jgi:hypothetical protein
MNWARVRSIALGIVLSALMLLLVWPLVDFLLSYITGI